MHHNDVALRRAIHLCGSQAELARRIGAPTSTVNDWLNYGSKIPYDYAIEIVKLSNNTITLKELAPYAAKLNKYIQPKLDAVQPREFVNQTPLAIQSAIISLPALLAQPAKLTHVHNREIPALSSIKVGVDHAGIILFGHVYLSQYQQQAQQDIPVIVIDFQILLADKTAADVLGNLPISNRVAIGQYWEQWKKCHLNQKIVSQWDSSITRWDELIAQRLGFHSKNTYWRAKLVIKLGCTELVSAMDTKKLSIAKAAELAKQPKSKQLSVLNSLCVPHHPNHEQLHAIKLKELFNKAQEKDEQLIIIHDRLDQLCFDEDFADLVIADPTQFLQGQLDEKNCAHSQRLIETLSKKLAFSLHQGGSLYLVVDDLQTGAWQQALSKAGLQLQDILVWHTQHVKQATSHWQKIHQLILWCSRGEEPLHFHALELAKMQSILMPPSLNLATQQQETAISCESNAIDGASSWLLDRLMNVSGYAGGNFLDPFARSTLSGQLANAHGMRAVLIEANEVNHLILPNSRSTGEMPCLETA